MKKHLISTGLLSVLVYGLIVLLNFVDSNNGNPCNVSRGSESAQGKCFDAYVQNNGLLWTTLVAVIVSLVMYFIFIAASKLYGHFSSYSSK